MLIIYISKSKWQRNIVQRCARFFSPGGGGSSNQFPLLLTMIPTTWEKFPHFPVFFLCQTSLINPCNIPCGGFSCKTNNFSLSRLKNNSSKNMIYSNEQQITAWQLTTLQDFFQISNQSSQPRIWRFPIGLRTLLDSIGSHVDQLDWSRNNPISCGGFSLDDESARHTAS